MPRHLIALSLLLLALVAAAGCGGSGDGGGAVRFLVFGDPEEINAYRELVRAYQEQDSEAEVQLIEASDRTDLIARLSTSIAGGSPPDLFLMNYRFYGQFASKGAIEPMADRLADSEAFRSDDFYPVAMEAFSWQGEQLCLPQNVSSLVVYYNKTLFKELGVPEPKDTWQWNDLTVTASRLTLDANGNPIRAGDPDAGGVKAAIYGLGVEPTLIRIAPFVWSIGGELVDDDENPTRLTLDSPEAQVVLGQFLALRSLLGVVPSDIEVEAEDDEARFANGRLAMLLSSRRSTPTFRTITGFEWDVAPLPPFQKKAGILHSDAYCMTKASKNKDAAWSFMEFALGPEGQRIAARTGRTVPSLKEVANSEAFLDPDARPAHSQVWLDAIPNIRHVPALSTWPEIEDASEPILEEALYEGAPADEVAAELEKATKEIFARAER